MFNDQDNEFDNTKLTNLDSIKVNTKPTSDNELSTIKNIDDELDKNTTLRFNKTRQNYLKISVGNDTYHLTKYDRIQFTDTTEMRFSNIGSNLHYITKIYITKMKS